MKRTRGISLVELLLAAVITAVILVPILGIFGSVGRQWSGHVSKSEAVQQANLAADVITNETKDAMAFSAAGDGPTRPNVFTMPQTDSSGNIVTSLVNGVLTLFQPGTKVRYYLSDNTGSITATGTVLWREYEPTGLSWVTDTVFSLLGGGSQPRARLGNISSLTFATDSTPNTVIVTIGSTFTESKSTNTFTVQRRIYLSNHN